MDQANKWFRYSTVAILLLLFSFSTFGQCENDSIVIIQEDSCKFVKMSPKKFTEFYLYKKNLEKIKHQIPDVERKIDSLNTINKKIKENLEAKVDSTNKQKSILNESLKDCSETLAEIDLENMYLTQQNAQLKKERWRMLGYGTTLGVVTVFILKTLVQ